MQNITATTLHRHEYSATSLYHSCQDANHNIHNQVRFILLRVEKGGGPGDGLSSSSPLTPHTSHQASIIRDQKVFRNPIVSVLKAHKVGFVEGLYM